MRRDGHFFRLEAILEVPIWVLAVVAILVTVAVVASTIGVFFR